MNDARALLYNIYRATECAVSYGPNPLGPRAARLPDLNSHGNLELHCRPRNLEIFVRCRTATNGHKRSHSRCSLNT
eukprot:4298318-Pleurochrysis_carterae.AAC.1